MRRFIRDARGQDLVEYALVLPFLSLLIFGTIEVGVLVFSHHLVANAAREGARYGIIHPQDTAGIEAAARSLTTGLDADALQVSSSVVGNTMRVQVTYPVHLITGMVIEALGRGATIQLQSVAVMPIE